MKNDISEYLRNDYNKAADEYDYTRYGIGRGKLFKEISNQVAVRIFENLVKNSNQRLLILDFATGTGKLAHALMDFNGIRIVGFDISFNMLSKAIYKEGDKGISWVNGDGLSMPFGDNTFDHIISFKFLHIMENTHHHGFLKELHRVLKPGGKLIMDCNNGIFGLFLHLRNSKYRRKATRFYWPHHKYTLYKNFKIVNIIGEWFPFTAFCFKINEKLANGLNNLSHHFPFKYLCGKLILVFEK